MKESEIEGLLFMYKLTWNNVDKYSAAFRRELLIKLAENLKIPAVYEDKNVGKYGYLHNMILTYGKYNSTTSNKLGAIREFKQRTGCGLKYAKEYVEWVLGYPGTFEPKE